MDGWNYETAAHLLNRAGFGGPPEEIARLTDLGPEAALSSLLDYEKIKDPTPNPVWAVPDWGARNDKRRFKPCRRMKRKWRSRPNSAPRRSGSLSCAAGG